MQEIMTAKVKMNVGERVEETRKRKEKKKKDGITTFAEEASYLWQRGWGAADDQRAKRTGKQMRLKRRRMSV